MNEPATLQQDVLFFFDGRPAELSLYRILEERIFQRLPDVVIKVQKTQISFYGKHLFAAASLPLRRKKDWPRECLMVTFGLGYRLDSPRIEMAVEPYPNRWTHHVLLSREAQIDDELMGFLQEAFAFSQGK